MVQVTGFLRFLRAYLKLKLSCCYRGGVVYYFIISVLCVDGGGGGIAKLLVRWARMYDWPISDSTPSGGGSSCRWALFSLGKEMRQGCDARGCRTNQHFVKNRVCLFSTGTCGKYPFPFFKDSYSSHSTSPLFMSLFCILQESSGG